MGRGYVIDNGARSPGRFLVNDFAGCLLLAGSLGADAGWPIRLLLLPARFRRRVFRGLANRGHAGCSRTGLPRTATAVMTSHRANLQL
jgi:hypothetical protein